MNSGEEKARLVPTITPRLSEHIRAKTDDARVRQFQSQINKLNDVN